MESYNLYLYHERTARGLKMRAFAEKLKISTFKYHLIENGYIKPDKELVGRISSLLKTDYEPYTLNENSYPGEKPEKKSRFAKWKRIFREIGSYGRYAHLSPLCTICCAILEILIPYVQDSCPQVHGRQKT